jgi:hypothetical protein
MFRASSAHLQEVNDINCTCKQPLVFSFSAGGRLVHLLRVQVHNSYINYIKLNASTCFERYLHKTATCRE